MLHQNGASVEWLGRPGSGVTLNSSNWTHIEFTGVLFEQFVVSPSYNYIGLVKDSTGGPTGFGFSAEAGSAFTGSNYELVDFNVSVDNWFVQVQPAPEPSISLLFLSGLVLLVAEKKRNYKNNSQSN